MKPVGARRAIPSSAVTWAPLLTALAVLAVAVLVITPQPAGVFWDDGVYLASARSLALGDGYRFANLPGAPSAVHFPPLWPALLAIIWRMVPDFPSNMNWFRLVNPVLAAIGAGLACAYAIRVLRLPPLVAAIATTSFALLLPVLVLASVLFAEPLFFCLVITALFATHRATRDGGARAACVAGAVVGIATLVRSTGIVLVPAMGIGLLLARRNREAAIATIVALLAILPWQLWSAAHLHELAGPLRGNYGPYLSWFADAVRERGAVFVAAVARQNVASFERTVAIVFFPIGLRELRPLLVALVTVVVVLGLGALWKRAPVLVLFLLAYAAVIIVWPFAPDRFAWAVWPIVGIVLAAGGNLAWGIANRDDAPRGDRRAAGLLVTVTVLAMAGGVFYTARGISRGWGDVAQRRNADRLLPVVDWVRANTPVTAVVACDGEPLVHLYTGRRVVPVHILSPDEYLAGTPIEQGADDLRRLIRAGGADFAVLSAGATDLDVAVLLRDGPEFPRLIPIDTLPGGGVAFRVQHGDSKSVPESSGIRPTVPPTTRNR